MALSRFLYVPNLIGYARIILMFIAYIRWQDSPWLYFFCYAGSQVLDMFDGKAARMFNQATKFGAMLDMVTDRCSGIGLMLTISHIYPDYTLLCHIFIWLDIFSHWCHMLAQLSAGTASHKLVTSGPKLLQYYYKTNWFMVLLIFGAEGFPLYLYMIHHIKEGFILPFLHFFGIVFLPLFSLKHIINVVQLIHASIMLDEKQKE